VEAIGRIHLIACGVLALDVKRVAERLGLDIATEFLEGGLHNDPGELRRRLQEAIDRASARGDCDRVVVGYGVCGRGAAGVYARNVPLVFPRAHDCIALFLGSDAAYKKEFARFPGTYYISAGWFTEKVQPKSKKVDGPDATHGQGEHERLVAKYGEDNARDIAEFKNSWRKNYQRAVFIDTGVGGRERYAEHARTMAEEFGWKYEEIPGELTLIEKMLTAEKSTPETLIVPPHHITRFDPIAGGLTAVPVWKERPAEDAPPAEEHRDDVDLPTHGAADDQTRLGLGIDAGGTYTDVVVYDFAAGAVLAKGKALTTKWDYTVGISEALAAIDREWLAKVDLISLSTTLATNAIVEGHGQSVGLLLMPPYGIYDPSDVDHSPKAAIAGRLDIDGREIAPIDPEEVRRIAREMVDRSHVGAFAVSGFAGAIDPVHELQVKAIVREETGLSVTCGHELSEMLDFRTRAMTAALNARIMPRLERFLRDARETLRRHGAQAPIMVVKGDGSLMGEQIALERPIETILSGPAASVAGARQLTDRADAIVLDMGGTTSDTAMLRGSVVKTCDSGARVGQWKTHVHALDMRTVGLGGDSLVTFDRRRFLVGPQRVAPIAWLAAERPGAREAIDYVADRLDDFAESARPMELLTLTGRVDHFEPRGPEKDILALLSERPHSLYELTRRTGAHSWKFLRLERLEEEYIVQRCGLTPTDALHALGEFERWDVAAARRFSEMLAHLMGVGVDAFFDRLHERIVRGLATELLKKQLDDETDPDAMDDCPACQTLLARLLASSDGGSDRSEYGVAVQLRRPVIGLGAPAIHYLPEAARRLGTEAIVPPDADVANAIGAVTSLVSISHQARVGPNGRGEYAVHGLPEARAFAKFEDAHDFAVAQLRRVVRDQARAAGAGENRVILSFHDRISESSDGAEVFLERIVHAGLTGPPDVARLRTSG
jgi:N-methylhydantoinase A/oxoprolinase/acetone carboxylase beta subunit